MREVIDTILLIVAAICFGLATLGIDARVNTIAAGLLCLTLTQLI